MIKIISSMQVGWILLNEMIKIVWDNNNSILKYKIS